jgi:WD40 repeat protein
MIRTTRGQLSKTGRLTIVLALALALGCVPCLAQEAGGGEDANLDGILDILGPPPGVTVAHPAEATGGAADVEAGSLLAISWNLEACDVWGIDEATGACGWIGCTGFEALNSSARDRYGRIFSVENDFRDGRHRSLVQVDPDSGAGTFVATLDLGDCEPDVRALAFSPDDRLYAINNACPCTIAPDDLYRIELSTGVGTRVGPTGLSGIQGLAFSPDGQLFGWDMALGLVEIDPVTGTASDVDHLVGAEVFVQTLAFTPDGRLLAANNELWEISTADGSAMRVGSETYRDVRGLEYVLPYLPLDLNTEPYRDEARINVNSARTITVAVLGNDAMDVRELVAGSMRFGPWEAAPAHDMERPLVLAQHLVELNGDGRLDLLLHFHVDETGIGCGSSSAMLQGQLHTGKPAEGTATFTTKGCP